VDLELVLVLELVIHLCIFGNINFKLTTMNGIELISKERDEQINKHGCSIKNDIGSINEELLDVALFTITGNSDFYPRGWNDEFKSKLHKKDRIEQLAVAGALIAAEIDRLQYVEEKL